jgi:UDP-galactopyranose mutase
MKRALIVGGGFAGCAAAHQLTLMGGWDITLVEVANYLGAGNRTFWYGGHPYTFGPRHFLTRWQHVYDYLHAITPIRRCAEHEFITYIERDANFYSFPINMDDIPKMPDRDKIQGELGVLKGVAEAKNFEEYWVGSIGPTLYDKFVDHYSKKMWKIGDNREIDTFSWSPKGVALKQGPRAAWDDAVSGYPYAPDGYNKYFDVTTAGVTVLLGTCVESFDLARRKARIKGEDRQYDIIVSTLSPDDLMGAHHGALPYMGRDLFPIVLPVEHAFPENVYFVYYANQEPFTRIVEYKKFTRHQAPSTLIGLEIPSRKGKFYPVPMMKNFKLAERYYADMPEGIFSMGRNGSYRYGVDIDDCIDQAMKLRDILKQGGREHPVPGRTQATALKI